MHTNAFQTLADPTRRRIVEALRRGERQVGDIVEEAGIHQSGVSRHLQMWTTKPGFESWWGPEGFRVEVHALEAREGGALVYDMIADAPEAIAAMKQMGQPTSHATRGRFSEFRPFERLTLTHVIDFVPGMDPYETEIEVEFHASGEHARMVVTLHPHRDPHWTKMSAMGFTSQLTKLDRRFGAEAP